MRPCPAQADKLCRLRRAPLQKINTEGEGKAAYTVKKPTDALLSTAEAIRKSHPHNLAVRPRSALVPPPREAACSGAGGHARMTCTARSAYARGAVVHAKRPRAATHAVPWYKTPARRATRRLHAWRWVLAHTRDICMYVRMRHQAKFTTPDYFNSLTEPQQKEFMQIVSSGINNPDSTMGCYAMKPTDYDT